MKLSEFYAAVLPSEGKLIAATMHDGEKDGKSFKYFRHVVCDDHAALQQATISAVKSGTDVYYALASYKQGFHANSKGKTVVRVRDNVHKLKALWFDIDFKGGLSNPTEVVAALREFCTVTRMPAPSILVHSGNGIHVYWPLQTDIAYSRWQVLSTALKAAASAHGLPADLVCTADPARVLRPIGTRNFKDRGSPKPVVPLYSSGKLFDPRELEASLLDGVEGYSVLHTLGAVPEYLANVNSTNVEDLGHTVSGPRHVQSFVANIARKCGVIGHVLATNGEDCSEPEWTACLQLAKHCADGELYYHALSEGHPDYTPEDTAAKWQQRQENDAGPTLCETFAAYRPDICKTCTFRGKIKTPLSLGEEEIVTAEGKEFPLSTWRPVEGNMGMEKKMFDPASKQYLWEKVLFRSWELNDASCDMVSGAYTLSITSRLGNSKAINIDIPGQYLGDVPSLKKELAANGCPIEQSEVIHWIKLMSTWLQQVQQKRQVGKSVSRLGWIEERSDDDMIKTIGFTAGNTSYLANGEKHTGLRIAAEYREIARNYLPRGDFEVWKEAADFIAGQDNPNFTAVLASAFASPLFGFTGMPGCMLTLVSNASGLGKSSVMKTAQAVWGSPARGMNSTSDTQLSIIRKTAFLKNLPVYWDEIRGESALESFYKTAFDIAQGKEKTRLTTNAEMREINDWKTMVIGASNESIFDYMGQLGGTSDAATARTFELEVEPFDDPSRAARNAMFGLLDSNYGHAGQRYAEYIAPRQPAIESAVRKTYESLYMEWGFYEGERFWCATIASLLVGAGVAKKAGLVNINVATLKNHLRNRVAILRHRTGQALVNAGARELVIAYIQSFKGDTLTIDAFPKRGQAQDPVIMKPPKSGKLMIVQAGEVYRFMRQDFLKWLRTSHGARWSGIEKEMRKDLKCVDMKAALGARTGYALPRGNVLEVDLSG